MRPERRPAVTDIDDALAALKADGFNHDDALRALNVLSASGFLITRPQTMLDKFVDAAMETRP